MVKPHIPNRLLTQRGEADLLVVRSGLQVVMRDITVLLNADSRSVTGVLAVAVSMG